MNTRAHLRLAAAALLVAFVSLARPAVAVENDTFGVTPAPERVDGRSRGTFEIPLEPGAEFEDAVRLYNRTDQELELVVYAADAEAGVDGTISVGFRASHPKGVGAWIKVARGTVAVPARGEAVVKFRVDVKSSTPAPSLGAIVVEHIGKGQSENLAQRLRLIVRTVPPNTPTTSRRVRSLLLRSPWIIVAIIGLVVALVLVWIGRRRSRHSRDTVVPAGEIELKPSVTAASEASRPVVRRLGASERDERPLLDDDMLVEVDEGPELEQIGPPARREAPPRVRKPAAAKKKTPARSTTAKKKPARAAKANVARHRQARPKRVKAQPKAPRGKGDFIPLDEL
jgi:hypothetical protein